MGCGDVCLLNDEGYRAIEGSSRPPLINLTVPQAGLLHLQSLVGRPAVELARDHGNPLTQQVRCRRWVRLHDVERDPVGPEPLDETGGDLIMATDDDVTSDAGRYSPRCPELHLGFEPRRVEEADKSKRQYDQQHHHP